MMMEAKLWAALCALLLINLTSAEHDDGHATASNSSKSGGGQAAPEASATESVLASSLDPTNHAATSPSPDGTHTNLSSRVTSSLSSNTTTEGQIASLTPKLKTDNGTNIICPSEAAGPESNLTDQLTSQPPTPIAGTPTPTFHTPLNSTTPSLTRTDYAAPVDITPTTTPPSNTFADSITRSNQPAHPKNTSFTSVPTSEPPNLETTITTTIAQPTLTSTTCSSQQPAKNSVSPTFTSPQNTLQPDGHAETSSVAHQKSTILPPSSPSAQAKVHANTPSQLNVGGDTTMLHESPTLDPLLAGLVSAFIITAVIITLLLFLKLRRRDNRPEFRRLQDLPMDDMMEDTPLSMYSY